MTRLANPIGWFEIHVDDMDRAKTFYESVSKRSLIEVPAPEMGMRIAMFAAEMQGAGAGGSLVQHPMKKTNATSPPTISIVVTAATISIDKFKKGRMAMAAQAMNKATKRI